MRGFGSRGGDVTRQYPLVIFVLKSSMAFSCCRADVPPSRTNTVDKPAAVRMSSRSRVSLLGRVVCVIDPARDGSLPRAFAFGVVREQRYGAVLDSPAGTLLGCTHLSS